jgi:hypothetical protein
MITHSRRSIKARQRRLWEGGDNAGAEPMWVETVTSVCEPVLPADDLSTSLKTI